MQLPRRPVTDVACPLQSVAVVHRKLAVSVARYALLTPCCCVMYSTPLWNSRPRGPLSCAVSGSLLLVIPPVPDPITVVTHKDAITMRRTVCA